MQIDPVVNTVLQYCTVTSRRDTHPLACEAPSLAAFHEQLLTTTRLVTITQAQYSQLSAPERAEVKDGPAYIFARFETLGVRTDEEVSYTTAIGLDVDEHPHTLAELQALIGEWDALIYETASSTSSAPRWRVVIPLREGLARGEHRLAFEHWRAKIRGVSVRSANPSRLWYGLTRFRESPPRVTWFQEHGRLWGIEDASRVVRSPLQSLLRALPPQPEVPVEGERNSTLSRRAASLLANGEVSSEDDLREALLDINATFSPPLMEREVLQMARSKWRARGRFGFTDTQVSGPVASPDTQVSEEPVGLMPQAMPVDFLARAEPLPTAVVRDWLPRQQVTLFSAHGGMGKSYIALDVSVRVALGEQVFGLPTTRERVVYLSCEDDAGIMRWRVERVCESLGRSVSDLDGWLFLFDLSAGALPAEMWVEDSANASIGAPTDTMHRVLATARQLEAGLIVADNASDVYAASENARAQVRAFLRELRGIAKSADAAILLLGHTSRQNVEYSGSTAWHNSVRSRWAMEEVEGSGARRITLAKSNYGPAGACVDVEWDQGTRTLRCGPAVSKAPVGSLAGLVLDRIRQLAANGVQPPAAMNAQGSLQSVLRSDVPELRAHSAKVVQGLLGDLERAGELVRARRPAAKRGESVEYFEVGK